MPTTYDRDDLLRAFVDDPRSARYAALAAAFGCDLAEPPRHDLDHLLHGTLASLCDLRSPFAGYLEAPRAIAVAYDRHGDEIRRGLHAARVPLLDLAAECIDAIWPAAADRAVTADDLRRHGYDPDAPVPDPDDVL